MQDHNADTTSPRLALSAGRGIFGQNASGYNSARLGYPKELYDRIFDSIRAVDASTILEIGAGTGLATRDLLARNPRKMVVVEPDTQMAEFLGTQVGRAENLTIQNCAFEDADLPAASFDLATAAASFHWLEPVSALAKITMALKPCGTLALWWNVYRAKNIGDEFADALAPLLEGMALPPSEGAGTHHSLDVDKYRNLLDEGGFDRVEHLILRRERTLDAANMRALYESYSFVRLLPEPERLGLLDGIADLVETRFCGNAPNIILTPLYVAMKGNAD